MSHERSRQLSRRSVLASAALGLIAAAGGLGGCGRVGHPRPAQAHPDVAGALTPKPALSAVQAALRAYPLVGLADRHGVQQEHDFIQTVLRSDWLGELIQAIVVEFGNPRMQSVADAFVVDGATMADDDVRQIWRQTGSPIWDAPVYERFFRTMRQVNLTRPRERRIRILLGDTPVDYSRVRGPADAGYVQTMENQTDTFMADLVEREVLSKGHRALLIAGGGHLRRGLHTDIHPRSDKPGQPPNAGTALARRHPGMVYVIDTLILGYLGDLRAPVAAKVHDWAAPALAALPGTWLGQQIGPDLSYRAMSPADRRYDRQADAVLYLGPDDTLSLSLPDPAIYRSGDYPAFLNRLSEVMSAVYGDHEDWLGDALAYAQSGPHLFP